MSDKLNVAEITILKLSLLFFLSFFFFIFYDEKKRFERNFTSASEIESMLTVVVKGL